MPNMSYCRFENTARDLLDCVRAVENEYENFTTFKEFEAELSSDFEREAFYDLYSLCKDFIAAVDFLKEGK